VAKATTCTTKPAKTKLIGWESGGEPPPPTLLDYSGSGAMIGGVGSPGDSDPGGLMAPS